MKKTIICLYAPANCGKTKTIRSLFLKFGGDKSVLERTHDFVGNVNFGNKNIGFASQGDPYSSQWEDINKLSQSGCDIIVTASRTKGNTVDNVQDIANRYDYDLIWISPLYFSDANKVTDEALQMFAERSAESIAQYIIGKLI